MAVTERFGSREAIRRFHELQARANGARLGSAEFRHAMEELRAVRDELVANGINPLESWRERTKRRLGVPVPPSRPGARARGTRA